MRLSEFILSNIEAILGEWEAFARTILPAKDLDRLALLDHAAEILKAIALDMETAQTDLERAESPKVAVFAPSVILPQKVTVRSVFEKVSTKYKLFPSTAPCVHPSYGSGLPARPSLLRTSSIS